MIHKNKHKHLNPAQITASVTASANLIAKDLSGDELNLLAAIFTQFADTLTTIAVVREINENNEDDDNTNHPNPASTSDEEPTNTTPRPGKP